MDDFISFMLKYLGVIFMVIVIILFGAWIGYNIKVSDDLGGVGDCVNATAKTQGYTGTAYEKWLLFADYCAQNE